MVAVAWMMACGLIQSPDRWGGANESTTRGSLMFRSYALYRMWVLIRLSSSSPIQMAVTWGLPSALMVATYVSGPIRPDLGALRQCGAHCSLASMSKWDCPLDHPGRRFSVWNRHPSKVRRASASNTLAMMYGSGGVDSGVYVDGQELSTEVGLVAVELDLSVGADVEGAVPAVPDQAVTDS